MGTLHAQTFPEKEVTFLKQFSCAMSSKLCRKRPSHSVNLTSQQCYEKTSSEKNSSFERARRGRWLLDSCFAWPCTRYQCADGYETYGRHWFIHSHSGNGHCHTGADIDDGVNRTGGHR